MSAGAEGEPFAEIGIPTFNTLVDFDRARNDLYDTLTESAAKSLDIPADEREHLRDMTESVTESFSGVAKALLEIDDDLATKAVDLKCLWFGDEVERAVVLANLSGCGRHFRAPTIRQFNRIFKDLIRDVPTIDEMADEATSIFMESINTDVEDFFNHWDTRCKWGLSLDMPNIDYEKYLKIAGKQALDVSKIAAGVGLGMLITRKFGKPTH